MPKFSVIITLYNKEKHILNTLNSVFKQTFTDYEIIVVNDGSTDSGLQIISELKKNNLFIFDTLNQGVSAARNFAMQQAAGDFFAFLDADDIWLPHHLNNLNQLIINFPNCGLYATNYCFNYGSNFTVNTEFPTLPKDKNWNGIIDDFFLASITNRVALTSAIAIPKKILENIGGFNIKYNSGEDTDYWTRIVLKKPVAFTKNISLNYNCIADSKISNINPSQRKFMTFDDFLEDEKQNISLKKFNDMYRAELALKHRIIGDYKTCTYYLKNINYNNASKITQLLLKLPAFFLKPLWKIKQWLKTKKIDLRV